MKLRLALTVAAISLFAGAVPVFAAPATHDTSPVVWFKGATALGQVPGTVVSGAHSTLLRTDNGVGMTLHTSQIPPNTANTVWWIVFNNPQFCSHGMGGLRCGGGDFGVAAVQASVLRAAGHVVGGDGVGDFAAYLQIGVVHTEVLFGPGLLNSRNADVHLVVRTHGAPIPGLVDQQIHSFGGGCAINTCLDIQATAHEAG